MGTTIDKAKRKIDSGELEAFFSKMAEEFTEDQLAFVCIGTDRSTGDALGPLTGSRLSQYGFSTVIGTLEQPCDADTLEDRLAGIPPGKMVVAIDACLGLEQSIGCFLVAAASLTPAESVGLRLPAVGDFSIAGIVGKKGPKPYQALQVSSLYRVMLMAGQIADSAAKAFGRTSREPGFI